MKVLCLFGVVAFVSAVLANYSADEISGPARVIDGDSLEVAGHEIRLFGIDAPEYSQSCSKRADGASFDCGREAREHLKRLVANREVHCNGWERDKYERLLATCTVGSVELNEAMVTDGWAIAFGDYERSEKEAERAQRGLWAGEFVSPSKWRQQSREAHSGSLFRALKFW